MLPTVSDAREFVHANAAFLQIENPHDERQIRLQIPDLKRFLALARVSPYWMEPFFGTNFGEIPNETQFLLYERTNGKFGVVLPLVAGDWRATLRGEGANLLLQWEGAQLKDESEANAILAFAAQGNEPFSLVQSAMKSVAQRLRSFRLRPDKEEPEFAKWLGWCTWDAFYQDVSAEKVLDGLRSFQEGDVQPRFVILDDGWQDTDKAERLVSFEANAKFPGGLEPLIQTAKEEFGVELFGVWHALNGYWTGVSPDGPLGQEYEITATSGLIRPWNEKENELFLVAPRDVYRFYHDLYRRLARAGVAMTKVDGQSALECFSGEVTGRVSTMLAYQEALQGAAAMHFGGNLLHCMCNGSDVAYHLFASTAWRNSDDFFPKKPASAQQKHVHVNAFNNVWTHTFSLPDWDMFQSHHETAEFHAAARAISGGPIYVCDKPGQQNFELIRKLCLSSGETLRPERPALPTRDCLFTDTLREQKLLKITNSYGPFGILGIFHCQNDGRQIRDSFCPSDVPDLGEGARFAAYFHQRGELQILNRNEACEIELGALEWEIVTLASCENRVAPLGLLDKFVGVTALTEWALAENECEAVLADGGKIGFWCQRAPQACFVDGEEFDGNYDKKSGLFVVEVPDGGEVRVELQL